MAINKNHEFEELNGIKCGIVEKNVNPERVTFLKDLLEFNGFTVVTAPTPPPKAPPAPPPKPAAPAATEGVVPLPLEGGVVGTTVEMTDPTPPAPPPPETFTVGVTDITFNPINAIFGRLLKARNGNFITLAYWNQEESAPDDSVPYYEKNA
ncbi:MAG TPA: hypothetical protein VLJ68_02355 [Chitinophagaceae bacterium]|nr:hypothetical protein [Chitinophagaceae bacterium]